MKWIRLTLLCALPLLCMFVPTAARREDAPQQEDEKKPVEAPAAIAFTIEAKDKEVRFFDPLTIRVELYNNFTSPISLDLKRLKLIPEGWKGVGTGSSWYQADGLQLISENPQAGRIELPVGGSVSLLAHHENSSFDSLGRIRVEYRLVSTDPQTQPILASTHAEASFEAPPGELISGVWTAQTEADVSRSQPRFNEFLRLNAKAQEEDETDFRDKLLRRQYCEMTLAYMAGYAFPFLERASRDKDPFIREQAVLTYPHTAKAIDQLDAFIDAMDENPPRPDWAATLQKNKNKEYADWQMFALGALKDTAPNVRIAAVKVLTEDRWDTFREALDASVVHITSWEHAFRELRTGNIDFARGVLLSEEAKAQIRDQDREARKSSIFSWVRSLATDPDPGVRAAVQDYLSNFANENSAATVAASLTDHDKAVQERALNALRHSPQPPPLTTITNAFAVAKGKIAVGLIPLLLEQENTSLATTLVKGFVARSVEERLAILTAIAGHTDNSTLELVKLGLNDPAPAVQRAAIMRILSFPATTATPLIDNYMQHAPLDLRDVCRAARQEVTNHILWPFLDGTPDVQTSALESVFPSLNGTMPSVSPDGQWIAYVETGWGRPGGSGGYGSSNLISISHAVRRSGADDRVLSDMFLTGWLADSEHVATARDGFVSISDLNGNVVAEFGSELPEQYRTNDERNANWRSEYPREQFGAEMPHQKYLSGMNDGVQGGGALAAVSPDGKWLGPLQGQIEAFLLGADGEKVKLYLPAFVDGSSVATWSPNTRYIVVTGAVDGQWMIIDTQTRGAGWIYKIDAVALGDQNDRWNPWSRDGSRLTFLRGGQVWVSGPNGEGAKQLTFDSTRKASPTFSRNGRSIGYLTWQSDDRLRYNRLGPTDLWVVDIGTTLATRVTAPSVGRINGFNWLDDDTLIFDRHEQESDTTFPFVPDSSLWLLSLAKKPGV